MNPAGDAPPSPLTLQLLSRCRFPPAGTAVECAVSGGPDSSALVVLAVAAGLDVTVVHVDHGLRPESASETACVEELAVRFGARFEARSVAVAPGPNLEARARDARYAALANDVLTGHTLDDQAETVLMFLMRGTGPDGVAGIAAANRPLLGLRRAETERLCAELGVRTIADPTNDDPRFTRNRVRHELLPLMEEIAQRDVAPLIARTAALQREALDALDRLVAMESVDPTDAKAVAALPDADASRVLRRWWRDTTEASYGPDAGATARMVEVARGSATATDVVAGWRLKRTAQRLRLVPPANDTGMVSGQ